MSGADIVTEILMFFCRVSNIVMIGALLFCTRQKKRIAFPYMLLIIAAYFIFVNAFNYILGNTLTLFGWLDISYFIYPILTFIVIFACFRIPAANCLQIVLSSVVMQHLVNHIGFALLINVLQLDLYSISFRITYVCMTIVAYIIMYFIFIRKFDLTNNALVDLNSLIIFSTIIIIVTLIFNQYIIKQNSDSNGGIAYHTAMCFGCLCLLMLMMRSFEKTKTEYEKDIIEILFKDYTKKQEYSQQAIELVNRKYHDIKREIAAVKATGEGNERLSALENEMNIYKLVGNTDNSALDAILADKTIVCINHSIIFSYLLDGKDFDFVDPVDLYCLLGNAIDNAIEYLLKIDEENRVLSIRAKKKGNILYIEIENYLEHNLETINGLPQTTKNDKTVHGFGLKSIKYLAEKYGGSIAVMQKDNRFILNIILFDNNKN